MNLVQIATERPSGTWRSPEEIQKLKESSNLSGKKFALTFGTTMFPYKVKHPEKTSRGLYALKSAKANTKVGKGRTKLLKGTEEFRGRPVYSLTLIERETCPETCAHWDTCYTNAMPFAHRYAPGPALEEALRKDVDHLATKHPDGFVVRLHIAGDYYSVEYVHLWMELLSKHPELRIYSYTHRQLTDPIGRAATQMAQEFPERVSVLRSDPESPDDPLPAAYSVMYDEEPRDDAVVCPVQMREMGGSGPASCLECGLCMRAYSSKTINIQFLLHGNKKHNLLKGD